LCHAAATGAERSECVRYHNKHTKDEENLGNCRKNENWKETLLFTRQKNDRCIYRKKIASTGKTN